MNSVSCLLQHSTEGKQNTTETFHILNMKQLKIEMLENSMYSLTNVESLNLQLIDTCQRHADHPNTLGSFKDGGCNRLSVEFKTYKDPNFIKLNKYSSYMGVRIENAVIIFLKRNTMEIITYLRNYLLKALYCQINDQDKFDIQQTKENIQKNDVPE